MKESPNTKQAREKFEKLVVNQPHPLDLYSWPRILLFRYLSPIYELVATGREFGLRDNFRAPQDLRCQNNLKRAYRVVDGEERVMLRMIKEFKTEFIVKVLLMVFSTALSMIKIAISKNLVDSLQDYASSTSRIQLQTLQIDPTGNTGPDEGEFTLRSVMSLIALFFTLETLNIISDNFNEIYTEIFVHKVSIGFGTFLFEEQLSSKFNEIHAKRFKVNLEGSSRGLIYQLFQLFGAVQATSKSIFMLVYGFYVFGPKFLILVVGLVLSTSFRKSVQKSYTKEEEEKRAIEMEEGSILSSVFDNLQYIKINALENFYYRKNEAIRKRVRDNDAKTHFRRILNDRIFSFINLLAKALFLGLFLVDGGVLSAGFVKILADLDEYILGYSGLSQIFGGFWEKISAQERRISSVLDEIEVLKQTAEEKRHFDEDVEGLENGTCVLKGDFYWNMNEQKEEGEADLDVDSRGRKIGFQLKNINFEAKKGSLTMIVGKIGSGKYSLLYALLDEMNVDYSKTDSSSRPTRKIKGSVAYLGQKPWIMNATVKENILLGRQYDEEFFQKCLRYSALEDDLTHWDKGIEHVVGDAGVALSGGQKARLALARCLYQDADIYLIDDVTSALDVHVGGMVFNKTIKEFLKEKTVVMTTHNLQFLKDSDFIYYMDQGQILVNGNFDDIKRTDLFKAFEKQIEQINQKSENEKKAEEEKNSKQSKKVEKNQKSEKTPEEKPKKPTVPTEKISKSNLVDYFLTPEDDIKKQKIPLETYITVVKELFGKQFTIILSIAALKIVLENYKDIWLSSWANRFKEVSSLNTFMIYNLISIGSQLMASSVDLASKTANARQSSKISSQMLYRVLHSNLEKFTDKIPNSTLQDKIKNTWSMGELSKCFQYFLDIGLTGFILILNIYGQIGPLCLAFIIPQALYSIFGNRWKQKCEEWYTLMHRVPRRARRNYYRAVRSGLVPLKAMRLQGYLRKKFYSATEAIKNFELFNCLIYYNKATETELFKTLCFLLPTYLMFVFVRAEVRTGEIMVALFIQSMENLSVRLRWINMVQYWAIDHIQSFEISMWFRFVDPEDNLKSFEDDFKRYTHIDDQILAEIEDGFGKVAEEGLVRKGVVELKNVSAKYSIHQKKVLKNLNLKVNGGEKIGIVGRTGSGKSSLIKLLWKYLDPVDGSILVDGKDIAEMDLKSYRSQINVVTQDTSLVYGTLRENLDPFGHIIKSDPEVVEYLKKLGFQNKEFLKTGLDMKIEGSGTNLSMGERQVIAFARILLRPKKLVVLDEATSSMDIETEEFIQQEIDKKLKDSTMLIIADCYEL